jgi:hypothetical protein
MDVVVRKELLQYVQVRVRVLMVPLKRNFAKDKIFEVIWDYS